MQQPRIRFIFSFLMLLVLAVPATAQRSYSEDLAHTAMTLWKDSFSMRPGQPARWSYDQGVILKGIEGIWNRTGDGRWYNYIQKSMDFYVQEDGTIKGYRPDEFNIDHINNGKLILLLYQVTGKEKYKKAAELLRSQLRSHPRTSEGGFWHKKVYPSQMWLDGLYMGEPFYAGYAKVFGEDTAFRDITRQFVLMEKHSRDPKTGLLYHGWDESKQQKWADPVTGRSPNVWGRALGWFGMAMVDALDYFPENHPGRDSIIGILNRFAKAVTKVQDPASGLWWDVVDKPKEPKNYFEASASSMLVYTLAKGMRKGYLPSTYLSNAKKGFEGIVRQFIKTENGLTNLHGTVSVSGLGGNPYRDGSFAYYMSEKVIVNDPKGMGAFINAANEMELIKGLSTGKGKTVVLDNYFNHEFTQNGTLPFHYIWNEQDNNGYSLLGFIFNKYGVQTKTLATAPTTKNLKGADIYVIVDPDTEKETKQPNFIQPKDADEIYKWVKEGGVLVLLGNDSGNVEFTHFNQLANKFGIRFNIDSRNRVIGNNFETGTFMIPTGHPIFQTSRKIYIKEYSSQTVTPPAKAVFSDGAVTVMSVAKVGKGTVFAVGDPWFYNEYLDGRKLPADIENYRAAEDLVRWLIKQTKKK